MARISTYAKDANITSSDKLLGSNYQGLDNQGRPIFTTANFKVEDLLTYFQDNISIGGENFNQVAADLGRLKSNYIYDENGNISGLSSAFVDIIASSDVSDNYATASFQTNMETNVLTFDGQGGYTVSAAFANSIITTTSSDRFATSEFVNNLGSSFGTVGIDGSVTISEAFANSVISTQTSGDLATAAFVNNLATSIGTVDAEGNVTVSEAFANSVMQTESATDYAQASFVNNLASSIGTVDINGNVTVSESFANSVMNTENTTDYAQAQFVNNIASSIGTVDAEGNITVSESFANSVMQTENTTDYASAQSVTDLSATVSTKPDIYRQDTEPATTVALGSLWYETDNNNALHVLVDVNGTPTWVLTDDERIGALVDSTATINQTLNTHATDIGNNATFATNLAGSFGTYDAQGNLTGLSEAFANSVMNTETATDYASSQSVTDLTATVSTKPDIFRQATEPSVDNAVGSLWYDTGNNNQVYVLVDGDPKVWTLTDDSRIGTLVDSTATINQTLQSQATDIGNNATFATGLAGSFGTYDASTGELTGLSEAFANDVFSTTTSTNFATSQSVTNLSSAVDAKPDVFRQTTEPSTDNAIGSIWYDTTNDANLPYVLVDVSGTKTWVATGDKRIVTNASSISNVSDSLSTTNSAVLAAANKITELETQFTFDTEGNISGVADTLSQSISTAQSDAESASASKVDTLAATFYTGYNNADGTFTALNISEAFANEVFDTTTSTNFASTDSVTTLSSAVSSKPDVFRQGSTTEGEGEPATTGAIGSLWYDTDDNNKVYILIDNAGTKEWAESTDGRVVTNANSISNVSDSLSTTNTNLSAAADKITELQTQFTFDTEGGITGTSDTLNSEISTAESNATSAAAGKVETLAANFFTGYDAGDGSLTGVSFSDAVQTAISGVVSTDGYASADDLNTLTVTVEGADGTGGLVGSVSTLQSTVASKPEVFRSGTQPAVTEPVGSLWFDTANGNKAYILVSGDPDNTWEEATDTNIINSIADKPFIFRQGTTQPAITNPVGSLWYDTDADNKLYVLTAGDPDNTWEATVDGTIAAAQSAADTAQDAADAAQLTANNRPKVFRQTTAPDTTEPEYSIWYDTTDGANTAYVLINGTWEETLDGRVGDLLDFVESSYAISTDANGVVTGMELYSRSGANSTLSEVKFTADKFVVKSSTVEATPFILDSNSLKLNVPLNGVSGSFSGNLEAAGGTFRGAVDILDSDNDTVVKIHSNALSAASSTGTSTAYSNVSNLELTTWSNNAADITYVPQITGTGSTISSIFDDDYDYLYSAAESVTFDAGSYQHTLTTAAITNTIVALNSTWNGFVTVALGVEFGNSDFSTVYLSKELHREQILADGSLTFPATSNSISLAFATQTTVYVRFYWRRLWKTNYGTSTFYPVTLDITSDLSFAGKKGRAELSPDGIQVLNTDDIYFKIDRASFTSGNPYVDIGGDVKIDGDLEITGNVNFSGDINNSDVTVSNLQNRLAEIASDTYIGSSSGGTTFTVRDNLIIDGNLTVSGTTTTIEATNLAVADNMIYLNDGSTEANPDLGIAGNYNDGTYAHAGIFRDASNGYWTFYDSYTPEPDDSIYINVGHTSFNYAAIAAGGYIVGDGTSTGFLKANGTVDTNVYVTSSHNHDGTYLKLADGGTVSGDLTVTADVKIEDADLYLDKSSVNGAGGRRIRFTEEVDSSAGYQGAYIHYNGDNNLFILGTHDAANSNAANDVYAIQMSRGTGNVDINNNVTAAAFVKRNGTSSQFLKADGSTDDNSYALSDHDHDLIYLSKSGGTITGNVKLNDSVRLDIGTGSDLRIQHNGTHSYIDGYAGNILIRNTVTDKDVFISSDDGDGGTTQYFRAVGAEGSVYLYHYGAKKFETTSTGVTITGNATATTFIGALQGNADTATWADTVDVNANDAFGGTYNLVWHAGDILYSSSFMNINGATDTLSVPNISTGAVSMSGSLKGSEADSLIKDFVASGDYENEAFYNPDTWNAYAGANHWAAGITLTNVFGSDRTTALTELSGSVFNYGGNASNVYFNNAEDEMVIEIDHTTEPLKYHAIVGIQWTTYSWAANRVKIEAYNGTSWYTGVDTTSNSQATVLAKFSLGSPGIQKLRITLGDPVNSSGGYMRISKIFGTDYQGFGAYTPQHTGTYYIEKYRDNSHYSNIYPELDSTYSLGTSSKRYSYIYGDNLIGNLSGGSVSATTGTFSSTVNLTAGVLQMNGSTVIGNNKQISALGASFTNPVTIYDVSTSENPRLSMGRQASESINFDVGDAHAVMYFKQDTDSNAIHTQYYTIDSDSTGEKVFTWQARSATGGSANTYMSVNSAALSVYGNLNAVNGDFSGDVTIDDKLTIKNPSSTVGFTEIGTILNNSGNEYIRGSIIFSRNPDQIVWNNTNQEWDVAGGGSTDWSAITHGTAGIRIFTGAAIANNVSLSHTDFKDDYLSFAIDTSGNTNVVRGDFRIGGSDAINKNRIFTSNATASNSLAKYTFAGDTGTGLGYIAANSVGLLAGGSRKFYVASTTAFFQNLANGVDFTGTHIKLGLNDLYIDGAQVTASAADLNYAEDLRATGVTALEFSALDDIDGNIQTQINNIDAFKYKSVADADYVDGFVDLFEMKTPSANLKGGSNLLAFIRTRWVGSTESTKTSTFFNITASEDGLIAIEANAASGEEVRYRIIQDSQYPSNYIFQIRPMIASALDIECFMFETTKKGSVGAGEIITTGFSTYTTAINHDIYEFSGKRYISFDKTVSGTTTIDTGVTIDGSLTVNTINLTGLASSGGRTTETTTVLISSSGGTYSTPRDLAELVTPSGASARSFLKFTVFGGGEFLEKKYVCDWNNSASEWTINVATEESSGTYDVQYDFTDDKFKLHIVDGSTTLTYNAVTVTIDHLGEDVYYNSLA